MKKSVNIKRLLSLVLSVALLLSYVPLTVKAAAPVPQANVVGTITDPNTAHSWETMLGTEQAGNRYAGRMWVDKSVYQDGDTAILNTRGEEGSSFHVSLKDDEAFQIIFSALGSTMTTRSSISSAGPMDVVLILDDSTSMDDIISDNTTRLEKLIVAANGLLEDLLTAKDIRIGIVAYNTNSIQILPFGNYENGVELRVLNNKFLFDANNSTNKGGTIQAFDRDGQLLYNNKNGYSKGTNLQAGIHAGMQMLENADDVEGRTPVAIVLTDGASNTAVQKSFYDISGQTPRSFFTDDAPAGVVLATLLTAAYRKARVEAVYGKTPMVYGIGVDIADNPAANAMINPASAKEGFHSQNSSAGITNAYLLYTQWLKGNTVLRTETYNGSYQFAFDHGYRSIPGITLPDIERNINYVDTYYPVSSEQLHETFDQIYEELSSGVFNPISTSTSVNGGTGVDDTPLIYVDFIGQHMQIKEIQAITLFGNSYGVLKNADGTYTVNEATGTNPTTNERWNTAEDILISVTEQEDGTQKLEIRINQQILPIIMEQAVSETVGDVTASTITELVQPPLRVYYTVGVESGLLLPNGKVDVSKIQGYPFIDDQSGTVSFYSNRFGEMNEADDAEGITKGDAHVGFKPSPENRFYYHQSNQGIFTKITNKSDGRPVRVPENNEYGILWDDTQYDLTWMTYEDYRNAKDTDRVYTYVSYYRPTPDTTDAENVAQEVTYLVYTDWKYLKESVAFYDANSETYLNDGVAIAPEQVADAINAYVRSNPKAELYAVLGVGSLRTSRLHNMTVDKTENSTDTAVIRYAPEYTYETASVHNGNDVVVWLGNNGRLTVPIDTGIALTKTVTEDIGDPDDTYALTVTIPAGTVAAPVALDAEGKTVPVTYQDNVLTVNVKAGQTVYIHGIPGGTECEIGEIINGDYYIANRTAKVTVPLVSEALNGEAQYAPAIVTNAPNKYGNLFITKEMTSDHAVPGSVLDTAFEITVNVGAALAGQVFTVEDSEHTAPYEVTVDDAGNMVFLIKARQTVEILRLPEGTAVTVTETAPGDHFAISYRTRNHSGEDADADNALVIPPEGSATAVVMNHYTPTPVSVELDIAGTKNFIAEGPHDGGAFVYQVQKWNGTAWENISGKTAQTPYEDDEAGVKTFTIEDVLADITYTEVGSHAYQVIEVKGNVANVTYDRTLYTFNVTVTDNNGRLVATVTDLNNHPITDGTYEVIFNNTYHTAPVSVDIIKEVENKSGDTTVSKAGFEFMAVGTDADWKPLEGADASEITVFSDAAGEARLTATYNRAGVYRYVLTENGKNAPGWTYSNAQYRITVTVTEDHGELTAVLDIDKLHSDHTGETATVDPDDATKGTVSFVNTYDPKDAVVNLDGAVSKALTGMKLEADQFTFYVYEDGDRTAPVLTGTNNHKGDVQFVDFDDILTFEAEGKYQFDIVEHIPGDAVYHPQSGKYVLNGMSYDPTIYDLVVEVSNDLASGQLIAGYYFEDAVTNVVTFHNSYKATPVEYTLGGHKVLHGRAPKNGEFTFELYEGNTLKQTVTNVANGSFSFRTITYTQAGTYTYTIKEAVGDLPAIRYDGANHPVTVTVTVIDTNGVLSASASISNDDIRFENTYSPKAAQVTFNGIKELVGGTLEDNSFIFNLYRTDHSFNTASRSAELLDTVRNVDGAFDFSRTLTAAGTYYFVILEDAAADPVDNVVYDRTQHRFTVKVSDIGDGQLRAAVTNMITGEDTGSAPSVSTGVAFTNATFDHVTEKEVYLADNTTTEIDGKKVNAGDILTYFISYTNYTGMDVVVNIMDTIPEHTSYVEGSASHNGGHAGTHVNWILRVAKGRTMTVSFNVKVDETNAIVANTAIVRDGTNTYFTNEVVNHTVHNELEKDVFSPEDTTTSIDGQKVYAGDELLYRISFTNTSADAVDLEITDVVPENTTYVDGSASLGGVHQNGAVVWNVEDLPAWSTVTVTFSVIVNDPVGAVRIDNQATATDGTNQYETRWVSNYTVEDEVVKDVFNAENTKLSIDGRKVYEGDELLYTVTYRNTAEEDVTLTVTDKIPEYTTYVEGSADNGGVYEDGVLTWKLVVAANESTTVSFKVKVKEAIGVKTITNTADVFEGKNTYTTNEVVNYTVKDPVKKNVFRSGKAQLGIDGQNVYAGDILVYAISYKNTDTRKTSITVTDKVPEYTTYVDGSADHGGVYKNGVLTWTVDVEPGAEVTVSFKVKVNKVANVTVTNKATVLEGKNTYATNEVSNPVAQHQVPDNPKTDDTVNLQLWLTILLLSGGGLITVVLQGRKREETVR